MKNCDYETAQKVSKASQEIPSLIDISCIILNSVIKVSMKL